MLISFSLALVALAAGMFLLAQTMKDNLNLFFKVVAYFIIVASFLGMACIGIHGAVRMYSKHEHPGGEMRMGQMGMMGGRWGRGMHFHGMMRGDEFHDGMKGDSFHGDGHDGYMHDGAHADGGGKDGGWGWRRGMEKRDSTQHKN
jgi:hypothetical protein